MLEGRQILDQTPHGEVEGIAVYGMLKLHVMQGLPGGYRLGMLRDEELLESCYGEHRIRFRFGWM